MEIMNKDVKMENRNVRMKTTIYNQGLNCCPLWWEKNSSKYPNMKAVSIEFDVGESRLGDTSFSIYYDESDGKVNIKLVDEQQGNYAGGTDWEEGDDYKKLTQLLGYILQEIANTDEISIKKLG